MRRAGRAPDVAPELVATVESLAPYVGSAGYDVDAALATLDTLHTSALVRDCEAGVDLRSVMHP